MAALKDNYLPDELNSIILSKLKILLTITFGTELSSTYPVTCRELFIYEKSEQVDISYDFRFGVALISFHRDPDVLKVSFLCYQNSNNLYNRDVDYEVAVDNDLNFKSFSFWRFFEFSKDFKDNNKYTSAWSNLLFNIKMDNFFNVSKNFLYRNEESCAASEYDKKNLFDYGLNPIFYLSSSHFDELLLKFLKYCMVNTQYFYAIFHHYPNHICCMESLSKTVDFLNIFCDEYRDNLIILEYNLLLLDMQAI
jgi:hypothetical protein